MNLKNELESALQSAVIVQALEYFVDEGTDWAYKAIMEAAGDQPGLSGAVLTILAQHVNAYDQQATKAMVDMLKGALAGEPRSLQGLQDMDALEASFLTEALQTADAADRKKATLWLEVVGEVLGKLAVVTGKAVLGAVGL